MRSLRLGLVLITACLASCSAFPDPTAGYSDSDDEECWDDDCEEPESEGTNTSSVHINNLARAMCEKEEECYSDDFSEDYESHAECVEQFKDGVAEESNEQCVGAFLDFVSCYTQLSCNQISNADEQCADEFEDYAAACDL